MKITVPLGILLLLALGLGYMLGTEDGRARRDVVLVKLGRREADDAEDVDAEAEAPDSTAPAEPA